jgi:hypothetical protein
VTGWLQKGFQEQNGSNDVFVAERQEHQAEFSNKK